MGDIDIKAKKFAEKLVESLPKNRRRFLGVENYKVACTPCGIGTVFMYCTTLKHRDVFCKETIKEASKFDEFLFDAFLHTPELGFKSADKETIQAYLASPRLEFESKRLKELWEISLRDFNAFVNTLEHEKGYFTSRTNIRAEFTHNASKNLIQVDIEMTVLAYNVLTSEEVPLESDKPIYRNTLVKNFSLEV